MSGSPIVEKLATEQNADIHVNSAVTNNNVQILDKPSPIVNSNPPPSTASDLISNTNNIPTPAIKEPSDSDEVQAADKKPTPTINEPPTRNEAINDKPVVDAKIEVSNGPKSEKVKSTKPTHDKLSKATNGKLEPSSPGKTNSGAVNKGKQPGTLRTKPSGSPKARPTSAPVKLPATPAQTGSPKTAAGGSPKKTKSKPKVKDPMSLSQPPEPKKSPSPGPTKSSSRPPKAGTGNRDSLRLPRLRSTNSLTASGPAVLSRSRSAASSPSTNKRPNFQNNVTPRFASNIPIPVPDYPKSGKSRQRNSSSESGPASFSNNAGVFVPAPVSTIRRRPEFVIHPEWASEVIGADQLPPLPHPFRTKQLYSDSATNGSTSPMWPKRCKSAPPPHYRNPITWAE